MMLVVAQYVFRECMRRRVFIAVPVLTLAFLSLYALGTARAIGAARDFNDPGGVVAVDSATLVGSTMLGLSMFATMFLGAMLATFLTFTVIRGDADQGLLQPLIVRPLGRSAFLIGRYVGAVVIAVLYVTTLFAACVAITGAITDWWPDRFAEPALLLAGAVALVGLISILGSIFLPTVVNGITVMMVFGSGLTAGLLQQVGEGLQSRSLEALGRTAANLLPFEALYQGSLHAITADLFGFTGFAVRLGPFGGGQPLSAALYVWVAFYFGAMLGACLIAFHRKDV
jgi:Cu-processing system permease protein